MRASERSEVLRRIRAAHDAVPVEPGAFGRRELLALALGAMATACTRAPREEVVPFVVQPPESRPGRAAHYASAFVLDGFATGIVVESHDGRPTKIEGNPEHPASLGATGAFEQACVLSLYDPHRAKGATEHGHVVGFDRAFAELANGDWRKRGGEGLHLVMPPTSSPTAAALIAELREQQQRAAVWFQAIGTSANVWEGARLAFGRVLEPRFDLSNADVIVALDADFLVQGPQANALARQFGARRVPPEMNRLYVAESTVTATGTTADQRHAARFGDVAVIAAALAVEIGAVAPSALSRTANADELRFVRTVARDLESRRGRGAVIAGAAQPPIVHALAYAIDQALGNAGKTSTFAPSSILDAGAASHDASLDGLRAALDAGTVETLVFAGVNAAYTVPAIAPRIARAKKSFALAPSWDETATSTTFALAEAHLLESWGDARTFDGSVSVVQPLIEPLHDSRTKLDVLRALTGHRESSYDLVKRRFADDRAFRAALRRGIVERTALATVDVAVDRGAVDAAVARATPPRRDGIELVATLDPRVHDGRFANNAWLLELPRAVTSLTWTNAAELSPASAKQHGVEDGDEIEIALGDRRVRAPVCIVPGQPDGAIGLTLGWGRPGSTLLARDRGANAYVFGPGAHAGVTFTKTGARIDLPRMQLHHDLEGRDDSVARHRTLASFLAEPSKPPKRSLSLYEPKPKGGAQWAMTIDLSKCTGCSACVVACQAENNVPSVGPEGVLKGRIMHWLRIDTYATGNDRVVSQPMLCQHCEKAPCEYVCPVNATVHSPDGLNEQVYNRCIGTRFCSANCPYKVRRFNWFDYHWDETKTEQLAHNPDVTVRERGVMEKCTFCVQRLREHEIEEARGEKPPPPRTACQQACASGAIVFGDLSKRGSEIARTHSDPRAFAALEELGTEPRVRYLAKLVNPSPERA